MSDMYHPTTNIDREFSNDVADKDYIVIRGARENNLKDISLRIPRDKLVVFTGLSGSGKTSLAFDTIYAEGQRRYMESLSSYARQFLGQMDKPDVDYIGGLSPAISIDQKTTSRNPRSTVGTVTEIHDYLRLLYARVGHPHCPKCGKPILQQTVDQMVDRIMSRPEGTRLQLLSPVVRGRKGEYVKMISDFGRQGYVRVRVDGQIVDIDQELNLDKNKKHNIEVVVDRLVVKDSIKRRLADSLEQCLKLSEGLVIVDYVGDTEETMSLNLACPDCGISIEELEPRMFSFNAPQGACSHCSGLGEITRIDPDLVIPNKDLSLREGAISVSGWNTENEEGWIAQVFTGLAKAYDFSVDVPVRELPKRALDVILHGTNKEKFLVVTQSGNKYYMSFEGVMNGMWRRYNNTESEPMKRYYEGYMSSHHCPECHGTRYKPETLAVTFCGKNIHQVSEMPVTEAREFFNNCDITEREQLIADKILKEIRARLDFLCNVGLGYLTLTRSASTLSGGEAQRIRLATQIGSGLMGVLYILDEPSIGLHQRDNAKLLRTLEKLRDLGNSLIVVEHDEETMMTADHIVDVGPGAGENGGRIVAQGTAQELMDNPDSLTGKYLSGEMSVPMPQVRRSCDNRWLHIKGAAENNLKSVDVDIPLGVFTCVTGVSGSGKSSLINEVLCKRLLHDLNKARVKGGKCDSITGIEHLDKVIDIDQTPIGRTPRSNPATYTGMFDMIRELFAATPDAKMQGYSAGRFSFNVKGGRCEACQGGGIIKIEMNFLSDVYVPCEVCRGKRYNRETLNVRYKGKSISEVLDMTVDEALEFFKSIPSLYRKVKALYDVGLGYIRLGQPATTLSGGEAQRVKLATELSKRSTGKTMYILDEPTTGLHMDDVKRLIEILQRLTNSGNTILVIEHNLDVIKNADYIIDMGPEGGDKGGTVIAKGTPEQVAAEADSYTGQYLAKVLDKGV